MTFTRTSTMTTKADILVYLRYVGREISTRDLYTGFYGHTPLDHNDTDYSNLTNDCRKLVHQGYLLHPTKNTWMARE